MKRSISVVLIGVFLMGAASNAAHWGGGGYGGGGGWSHGGGGGGSRGGAGSVGHAASAPSSRSMSFTRNSSVTRSISSGRNVEVVPNHYYYHNAGGARYWHYYGRGGLHWYGFYYGPGFFWFPFYAGYWWWYDPSYTRWAYWYGGYWWWTGPGGVPYVYVNDDYVPYDQYREQAPADSSEKTPEPPAAPPAAAPNTNAANAPASEGGTWKSPDGKRMVQITGTDGGAYLFDESSSPPLFMKFFGTGAEKVRFSGGASGQPLQILVEFKSGGFTVFDADGGPAGKAPAAPAAAAPAR